MSRRVSSPRLIGREDELARLRAAVADAAEGRSRFVLVRGDAGIGKTRLVAELTASFGPDVRTLAGRCLAIGDGGLPYAPLAEAIRRLGRDLDRPTLDVVLGPARAELTRLVPDLSAVGAPRAERATAAIAVRADQARLFELLVGVLARLGAERPVAFVVEDVHWADDATRDLLTYLVANLRAERVLVLATLRTDEPSTDPAVERWLVELLRNPTCETIDVGPLSSEEVAEQLRAILGSPPSGSIAAGIAARSGGNALFVEELAAAGAGTAPGAAGSPAGATGGRAGSPPATVPATLPATLRDMLSVRIRGLSTDTTAVIRALALAGRAVDDRLLVAATGLPADTVDAALHDAIGRSLVVVDERAQLVDLHHVLLREGIVAQLLAGERRTLHAALATALTANPELGDPSPAGAAGEVANHWAAADRPVEAFRAALVAADAAIAVRAYADAARSRRRALDQLPRLPAEIRAEAPDEVALILEAEEAANLAGDFASASELLERGLGLLDPASDPVRAGILESRLGYHRWLAGRSDESLAHHRRAVELVPADPPSLERARVVRGLGGALMGLGRYRESAAICDDAIAAARAAGAPVEEGRALDMLGMDRFGVGDIDGGITALQAACAIARAHDPGEGLIVGLHNLAYHLGLADRPDEALAAALEGIAEVQRAGLDRRYGAAVRAAAADILLRLGRWDEADNLVAEGRALDPDGEGPLYLVIVRLRLATARGRFEDAREALGVGNRIAAGDVDFDLIAYLRTAEAELHCWAGEADRASAAVAAGLEALEKSDDVFLAGPLLALGVRAAADRAEIATAWQEESALQDARAAAAGQISRLNGLIDALAAKATVTRGLRATAEWARAESLRAAGDPRDDAWAALAIASLQLELPARVAYARFRRAEALVRSGGGDLRLAADELAEAAAEAARLGAEPLSAEIARVARYARIDLEGPGARRPAAGGRAAVPTASPADDGHRPVERAIDASALPEGAAKRDGGSPDARRTLRDVGLTDREIEVLELLGSGRTNVEIGAALGISAKSASGHVRRILARLRANTRADAGALAARLGLVDAKPAGFPAPATVPRTAARTFMFTDIVKSTALIDAIGDAAWSTLRMWHDATLRRLFESHGGVEVDHAGDGFFVAFPSASPAVRCAIAIQRTLAEHRAIAGFAPEVRIGLHHGEALATSNGWSGRDVHVAARLMARAGPGEIIASAATLQAARMPPSNAAPVSLRGLAGTVLVASVQWGRLGAATPAP